MSGVNEKGDMRLNEVNDKGDMQLNGFIYDKCFEV